jgi:hypothetical protein
MNCDTCCGSPFPGMVITPFGPVPCPNGCIGSIASCCDAAGSAQPKFRCAVGIPPSERREGSAFLSPQLAAGLSGPAGFLDK